MILKNEKKKECSFNGIRELPPEERPYEKCLRRGAETLSDSELLAVILRTGAQGISALELSRAVLTMNQSDPGLLGIYHTSVSDLIRIRGIGNVKAVQLKCIAELSRRFARERALDGLCFSDPDTIAAYYMEEMRHLEQEVLKVLMLNSRNELLHEEEISKGTVNGALISPREIFIDALRYRAVSIILLHNHPSGYPQPSREDILMTRRVREAGLLIGVELLDHIIIGDRTAVSLREQGFFCDELPVYDTVDTSEDD